MRCVRWKRCPHRHNRDGGWNRLIRQETSNLKADVVCWNRVRQSVRRGVMGMMYDRSMCLEESLFRVFLSSHDKYVFHCSFAYDGAEMVR